MHMRLPRIEGDIERRLLVNYAVDPAVVQKVLPAPFRPQLRGGSAVAGICLIRMGSLRPHRLPRWTGLRSEGAAHRVAVEWDTDDGPATGVYIPRRDTSSLANIVVGGRLYPGEQHKASFTVDETPTRISVAFDSSDGSTHVSVAVGVTDELTSSTLFANLAEASQFFEGGSIGYSATRDPRRFDGLGLETHAWKVEAGVIEHAESSLFSDRSLFPLGSATLDCALVMRGVPVLWRAVGPLGSTNHRRGSQDREAE